MDGDSDMVNMGPRAPNISSAPMMDKQLDRAPLRYRSAEHGPACLARSARSQTIGRFAPS